MTVAFFDCFSGISGDMTLGGLLDLGVPVQWLKQEIGKLSVDGFDILARKVLYHGIQATQAEVVIQETHHHRRYIDIKKMIGDSSLSETVKTDSLDIFERIARAEASIHHMNIDEVHFHEVGSMDAIVDVVGSCLGMAYLGIDEVICSPLPLGGGFVKCAHGTLPVPAPATLEILKGIPVYAGPVQKEMVTPTGAGIITGKATSFEPLPLMKVQQVGYGAGCRELASQPNLLRILIGDKSVGENKDDQEKLLVVNCALDDMNPELYGHLMDRLFADGALDVFWVPIHMKKDRPGTKVEVLCNPDKKDVIIQRILSESTTLGVRYYEVHRTTLERRFVDIETPWGQITVKSVIGMNGENRLVPEFGICRQIALKHNLPLRQVYETILRAAGHL